MNLLRYIQWHVTGYPRLNCYILSLLYVNSTYKNGQPSTVYFNDPAKGGKKIVRTKAKKKTRKIERKIEVINFTIVIFM